MPPPFFVTFVVCFDFGFAFLRVSGASVVGVRF